MSPTEKLKSLGLELPPAPKPAGSYVPSVRSGSLIFVSGQVPMRDGKVLYAGRVGAEFTLEQGAEASRIAVLNALAVAAEAAGGLDRIARIVQLRVFINSAPDFTDQPKVANGASDLLVEIFGEAGRHARAALGTSVLPLNCAVEIEMIAECRP